MKRAKFIYNNKIKDKYFTKSPKNIFYEDDRNTFNFNGRIDSRLEEHYYGELDNKCADVIRKLRDLSLNDNIFDKDISGELKFFIINLYWRLKCNDNLFKEIYGRIKIDFIDIKTGHSFYGESDKNTIVNDSNLFKFSKFITPFECLKDIVKISHNDVFYDKLFQINNSLFLLGDNPFVYKRNLLYTSQIIYDDMVFAISKNRLYGNSHLKGYSFNKLDAILYNIIVVNQAQEYVVSSDINFLKSIVSFSKNMERLSLIEDCKKKLFDAIAPAPKY